mgnify:CR=1 FL=1
METITNEDNRNYSVPVNPILSAAQSFEGYLEKKARNFFDENDFDFEDEDEDESKLHRRADVSMKMKTFMHYTSENDSKSSIDVEPNSVDNDKLHN